MICRHKGTKEAINRLGCMNTDIIHKCDQGALAGRVSFAENLRNLRTVGVERYHADLVRMEKTYYSRNGDTHVEKLAFPNVPPMGDQFNVDGNVKAIRAIQQREIDYPEFLRRIILGGTTSYFVFVDGGCVAYYGRRGECHIERLPAAA